jgi:hypothetical protein
MSALPPGVDLRAFFETNAKPLGGRPEAEQLEPIPLFFEPTRI